MSESNLEKVLMVFRHFKTKAGEALVSDHFLGIGRLRHWDVHDLQDGSRRLTGSAGLRRVSSDGD